MTNLDSILKNSVPPAWTAPLNLGLATTVNGPTLATHSMSPDHRCLLVVSCFLITILAGEKGQDPFIVKDEGVKSNISWGSSQPLEGMC